MGDSNLLRFLHYASRASKIKLTLVVVIGILIVTATLFSLSALWKVYKGPEKNYAVHESKEEKREPAAVEGAEVDNPYEIKGVSVGFMDKRDTRMAHAQFTLVFHCPNESCKKNLTLNHAKVLDTLFEVGSDFYVEDFSAPEAHKGLTRFKSKLTEQLQKRFAQLAPKGVSIQDWFMN